MYRKVIITGTTIAHNKSVEGETIENKVERIVNNKEPISDGAPLTFTERAAGVQPEYNPRTDRWDIAIDGMDKVAKAQLAKRQKALEDAKTPPKSVETTDNSGTSQQQD